MPTMTKSERTAMDAAIDRGERLASVWQERDRLKEYKAAVQKLILDRIKHRHTSDYARSIYTQLANDLRELR
jgi:uncharacterized protein YaaR (DUF327 family)